MTTTLTARIEGVPAEDATYRVALSDRSAWTFRARTFAAHSFIAPLTARAAIGGTITDRVSGV
jgi:hypothetical protein